jgi:hypothetical protein
MLTAVLLMKLFEGVNGEQRIDPASPEVQAMIETLPRDPDVYVTIADSAFAELSTKAGDDGSFEEFVDILRLLLYADGRTEKALLHIAELAAASPAFEEEGINALAGLANQYGSGSHPTISLDDLVPRLERLMASPKLLHNARECKNALLRIRD